MNFTQCLLIYLFIVCITALVDEIPKYLFKERKIIPLVVRALINLGIGGYTIYYLLNVYI